MIILKQINKSLVFQGILVIKQQKMQPYCQLPPNQPFPVHQNHHNNFLESSHLLEFSKSETVHPWVSSQSSLYAYHLALNKTFVVQISLKKVQHHSAQGEVLGVLNTTKTIMLSFMASSSIVILVAGSHIEEDRSHQIIQWDLQTYQTVTFPFLRQFTYICFSAIFTQSKLFCIGSMEMNPDLLSINKYSPQKFQLIYIKYPVEISGQNSPHQNPFHRMQFNLTKQQYSRQLKIVKINNKSMVGFIPNQLTPDDSTIEILIFELNNQGGTWGTLNLKHKLSIDWKICSVRVADIYEMQPQKIYVKLGVEPDGAKLSDEMDNQDVLYKCQEQHDFIYNIKTAELRPAKFALTIGQTEHFIQFVGRFRHQIMQKQQKPYIEKVRAIIRKNLRKNKKPKSYEPEEDDIFELDESINRKTQRIIYIYFVDPSTEDIVSQETRNFSIVTKYIRDAKLPIMFPVTEHPNLFIESKVEIGKSFKIFLKIRKIKQVQYPLYNIAVYMLNEMIENPDEDLLSEVANLLQKEKEELEWDWELDKKVHDKK